jgi:hypothetical protein
MGHKKAIASLRKKGEARVMNPGFSPPPQKETIQLHSDPYEIANVFQKPADIRHPRVDIP